MAKNPEAVLKFLNDLRTRLTPMGEQELKQLVDVKKDYLERNGKPFDGQINPWDSQYFMRIQKEALFSIDDEKIKEYFPIQSITDSSEYSF